MEDLIAFSNEKSIEYRGEGIDSLDLGDSLGFWDSLMREPEMDFIIRISDPRGEFKAEYDMELFEWEGLPE